MSEIIQSLQLTLQQMNMFLAQYGIRMYVHKVKLNPEDCKDRCIDYIVRVECKDPRFCSELKKRIKQDLGESK